MQYFNFSYLIKAGEKTTSVNRLELCSCHASEIEIFNEKIH